MLKERSKNKLSIFYIKRIYIVLLVIAAFIFREVSAHENYNNKRKTWMEIAALTQPTFISIEKQPLNIITITKYDKSFQGFKVSDLKAIDSSYTHNS